MVRSKVFFLIIYLIFIGGTACNKVETPAIEEITLEDIIELDKKSTLPNKVNESSGLIQVNDQFITHNDSGDTTNLYLINVNNGSLSQTKAIENIAHKDWEGMTQNETSIFIGDFGNNAGSRTDLKVYEIDKSSFELIKTIPFAYANQTNFDLDNEQHNFNMEAIIWMENDLYLFSKNHLNLKTYLYKLDPLIDSVQLLLPIDSFDVNGLVTDAAYWETTEQLALIGYDNSQDLNTFVYLFDDFVSTSFFNTTHHYFNLDINEQIEGCTFVDRQTLWITSERETNFGGNLYKLVFD